MCKAFSCIITKSKKVYWKCGLDSHEDIIKLFKEDKELVDDKLPPNNTFARIEVAPQNEDYLNSSKWVYRIDEKIKPTWLNKEHENLCFKEFKKWKKEVYSKINLKEAIKPINPFELKEVKKVTKAQIKLLTEWNSVWNSVGNSVGNSVWNSVWNSVGNSVWNSVGNSVWNSVGNSVWNSVRNSVRDSVWDSVWGYIGSLFKLEPNEWKYTEKIKTKDYPFASVVKLWKQGLVTSFDGKVWRLHTGKKAKIVFEISKAKLKEVEKH